MAHRTPPSRPGGRGGTRLRSWRTAAVASALLATLDVTSSGAAPFSTTLATPRSGPAATGKDITYGLHVVAVDGRRFGVTDSVHVLTFDATQDTVKVALAKNVVDGGKQTPRAMCRSTAGCVAAVNGDYFDVTRHGTLDPGDDVGGIIQNCVLLHTPEVAHQQANLDAQSVSQGLNWSSTVDVNGVDVTINAVNLELPISYSTVHLPLTGTLLFTPSYALKTPTAAGRVTYEFTQVDSSVSPTTINSTTQLDFVAQTTRAVNVSPGQVDISAPVGSALDSLQAGEVVNLTTTSSAGCDSIGGHPILLNHGVIVPIAPADTFMTRPFARSVIGWTASGQTVIMAVEGTDGKSGATARQLVGMLQSLHVVTALDLDGGGSTAFYVKDHPFTNAASAERAVSTSLVVVRN